MKRANRYLLSCLGVAALLGSSGSLRVSASEPGELVVMTTSGGYVMVNATVNDHAVRFVLDTGSEGSALTQEMTTRLGLGVTGWPSGELPATDVVHLGVSEPFDLGIWGLRRRSMFEVLHFPGAGFDGLLGWPLIKRNVFRIAGSKVSILRAVPSEASSWLKIRVRSDGRLVLDVSGESTEMGGVLVDTGARKQLALSKDEWRRWIAADPTRPKTLMAYYGPSAGIVVRQVAWADRIHIGPLTLTDVLVTEADAPESNYRATLGLGAFERLELIVNERDGVAHARPVAAPASSSPRHNRAGVVFVPADLKTKEVKAVVLHGGPAWSAGIRDGDVLLRVNGDHVPDWRVPRPDDHIPWTERAAGTKLTFTLRRGEREFDSSVVLRDLVGPGAPRLPLPRE